MFRAIARSRRLSLPRALALIAALALAGCGGGPDKKAAPNAEMESDHRPAPDPVDREAEDFARQIDEQLRGGGLNADAPPASADAAPDLADDVQWTVPTKELVKKPDPPSIDTPSHPAPSTATEPREQPAPDASPQADPLTTEQLVRQLADRLHEQTRTGHDGLKPYLAGAALSVIDPRREMTEEDMAALPTDERRLLLAYQRAFTLLGQSLGRDSAEDKDHLRLAAEELAEQLAEERGLRIRSPHLCERVNGYGVFKPFPDHTFISGREHPVIVYSELENFATERNDDDHHTVRLTQEIVLYNEADGLAVWRVEPTEIVDRSRNRRRDFFIVQLIRLPAQLTVGKYMLKVRVTDEVGRSVDETTLPLRIVADEGLAGGRND